MKATDFHKANILKRPSLAILGEMLVKDSQLISTDLETFVISDTDLPDGMYRLVGKNIESGLNSAEDFPILPSIENTITRFSWAISEKLARAVEFCSNDPSRRTLSGVCLDLGSNHIVTTDGKILSCEKIFAEKLSVSDRFIIPKKVALLFAKLDGEDFIIFETETKSKFISCRKQDIMIISKLIDEIYPNWPVVIPEKSNKAINFDANELTKALNSLSSYLPKKSKKYDAKRHVLFNVIPNEQYELSVKYEEMSIDKKINIHALLYDEDSHVSTDDLILQCAIRLEDKKETVPELFKLDFDYLRTVLKAGVRNESIVKMRFWDNGIFIQNDEFNTIK